MEKFLDALNARPKKLFVTDPFVRYYNTQTCPCNILCFFRAEKKMVFFMMEKMMLPYICSKDKLWVHVRSVSLRRL